VAPLHGEFFSGYPANRIMQILRSIDLDGWRIKADAVVEEADWFG
jgi:hypothetical protein